MNTHLCQVLGEFDSWDVLKKISLCSILGACYGRINACKRLHDPIVEPQKKRTIEDDKVLTQMTSIMSLTQAHLASQLAKEKNEIDVPEIYKPPDQPLTKIEIVAAVSPLACILRNQTKEVIKDFTLQYCKMLGADEETTDFAYLYVAILVNLLSCESCSHARRLMDQSSIAKVIEGRSKPETEYDKTVMINLENPIETSFILIDCLLALIQSLFQNSACGSCVWGEDNNGSGGGSQEYFFITFSVGSQRRLRWKVRNDSSCRDSMHEDPYTPEDDKNIHKKKGTMPYWLYDTMLDFVNRLGDPQGDYACILGAIIGALSTSLGKIEDQSLPLFSMDAHIILLTPKTRISFLENSILIKSFDDLYEKTLSMPFELINVPKPEDKQPVQFYDLTRQLEDNAMKMARSDIHHGSHPVIKVLCDHIAAHRSCPHVIKLACLQFAGESSEFGRVPSYDIVQYDRTREEDYFAEALIIRRLIYRAGQTHALQKTPLMSKYSILAYYAEEMTSFLHKNHLEEKNREFKNIEFQKDELFVEVLEKVQAEDYMWKEEPFGFLIEIVRAKIGLAKKNSAYLFRFDDVADSMAKILSTEFEVKGFDMQYSKFIGPAALFRGKVDSLQHHYLKASRAVYSQKIRVCVPQPQWLKTAEDYSKAMKLGRQSCQLWNNYSFFGAKEETLKNIDSVFSFYNGHPPYYSFDGSKLTGKFPPIDVTLKSSVEHDTIKKVHQILRIVYAIIEACVSSGVLPQLEEEEEKKFCNILRSCDVFSMKSIANNETKEYFFNATGQCVSKGLIHQTGIYDILGFPRDMSLNDEKSKILEEPAYDEDQADALLQKINQQYLDDRWKNNINSAFTLIEALGQKKEDIAQTKTQLHKLIFFRDNDDMLKSLPSQGDDADIKPPPKKDNVLPQQNNVLPQQNNSKIDVLTIVLIGSVAVIVLVLIIMMLI